MEPRVSQLHAPAAAGKPTPPEETARYVAAWKECLDALPAAPDALLRRVELANRYARGLATLDSRALAPRLFPESLSEPTRTAIARADSGQQALALLLVSPEMLRR